MLMCSLRPLELLSHVTPNANSYTRVEWLVGDKMYVFGGLWSINLVSLLSETDVALSMLLTDVVGGLVDGVGLEEVVGEHEGPSLHCVQQHGGRTQLFTGGQFPPRRLGTRLQQVVHRLHHGLGREGTALAV